MKQYSALQIYHISFSFYEEGGIKTNALFKLFIKDSENTEDPAVRVAYGKFSGLFGIVTNFVLFIIKLTLGVLTSNISVMADAMNNLGDAGSSSITLLGFKIAGKPADAKHPYGHARMEYISGLIVSCLITTIGLELLINSVKKILDPAGTKYSILGIIILFITVLIKAFQALVYRAAGRKIDSSALRASATDSISDMISTAAVIAGMIVGMVAHITVDGWLGSAIALFVIYSGIKLTVETADPLLGAAPDEETIERLSNKILGYDGIIGIHDLVVHNYGFGKCFASVHAEVPASTNVMISHDIIDNIEFDVLEEMNIHLVIHLDPVETDNPKIDELKVVVELILRSKDPEITMHDFRVVFGQSHTNLIFDVNLPIEYKTDDESFCNEITKEIRKVDPSYNTVITVDRNYMNTRMKNIES